MPTPSFDAWNMFKDSFATALFNIPEWSTPLKHGVPSFGPPTHRRSLGDQEDVHPCSENGLHDFLAFKWLLMIGAIPWWTELFDLGLCYVLRISDESSEKCFSYIHFIFKDLSWFADSPNAAWFFKGTVKFMTFTCPRSIGQKMPESLVKRELAIFVVENLWQKLSTSHFLVWFWTLREFVGGEPNS